RAGERAAVTVDVDPRPGRAQPEGTACDSRRRGGQRRRRRRRRVRLARQGGWPGRTARPLQAGRRRGALLRGRAGPPPRPRLPGALRLRRSACLYDCRTLCPAPIDQRQERSMRDDDSRLARGNRVRREVLGDTHVNRSMAQATDFARVLQEYVTETCWG